jgi:hypothetical protein
VPAPFTVTDPFAPRPVRPGALLVHAGWRIKPYDITLPDESIDESDCARVLPLALDALPSPAQTERRPGVGFCIRHQGRGWSYLVLCWWDSENELPIRIWTRERGGSSAWAPARPDQSICVWDAQVIAFERDAYIRRVLAQPDAPDLDGYLADRLSAGAPGRHQAATGETPGR